MTSIRSIHLVEPGGAVRQRLARALGIDEARSHWCWNAFEEEIGDEAAAVVLGPGLSGSEAWDYGRRITDEARPWVLFRAEEEEEEKETEEPGDVRVRGLSVGFPEPAEALPRRLAWEESGEGPVFELHELLRVVSRVRHDLNNPLTAGLAETQLLLMDVGDDEEREALETIQRQLRRIQEMIRDDLSRLRPPG